MALSALEHGPQTLPALKAAQRRTALRLPFPWKLPAIIHLFRSSRVDDAQAGPLAGLRGPALCRALWAEVMVAQMLFQMEKQVISRRFS